VSDVFISYSRRDREFVGRLREELLNKAQDVWIDWENIPPSQGWWEEIKKGISRANNFVIVLSPNSMGSPVCQMEIEYARELKKRIIPVLHVPYEREEAIVDITKRLAIPEQTATRQLWADRQAYNLVDANDGEMKHINYFFFTSEMVEQDFGKRFEALFTIINTDYEHKELHTRLDLRAQEWRKRGHDASFLLLANELKDAEAWLEAAGNKLPLPTELHHDYIRASHEAESERRRLQADHEARLLQLSQAQKLAEKSSEQASRAQQDAETSRLRASSQERRARNAIVATVILIILGIAVSIFAVYLGINATTAQQQVETQIVALNAIVPGATQAAKWFDFFTTQETFERAQIFEFGAPLWLPIEQDSDGFMMVLVPANCFMMGSDASEERPIHQQCIEEAFWIDKYEVSQGDFERLMGRPSANNRTTGENLPVQAASWFDAMDFCSQRAGRLPTEAEWEYAARGVDSLNYPWGNEFIADNVVFHENAGNEFAPVGSRPSGASWVGAMDMAGNAAEWTSSMQRQYPYSEAAELNYDSEDTRRIFRGGSIGNDPSFGLTSSDRASAFPAQTIAGFRCVLPYNQ
jgi:formylglycine-generating enzyme required for sulfatase activity